MLPYTKNSRDLPKEAYAKLESVKSKGISSFSFNNNEGWVIVTKNGEVYSYNISNSLKNKIKSLKQYNRKIKQIVFQPKKKDTWVIVTENSGLLKQNTKRPKYNLAILYQKR